jgi:N-acetylglucosamine kinase-like BadF-type ATPase
VSARPSADDATSAPAVLAVDGGNSKTEVAVLDRSGTVLGSARGPGSNHAHSDHDAAMRVIDSLVAEALRTGHSRRPARAPDRPAAEVAVLCLAGADFPSDERELARVASGFGWAERVQVCNDADAMLRAGTDREIGVVLVCGAGVNCMGRGSGGRTVRFPALGDLSGDWGGGFDVGMAALGAAVRAQDGRGARTVLRDLVPAHFGLRKPSALVYAMYTGRIHQQRVIELPAIVFGAADDGDVVAAAIVDRLCDELVGMVGAALRRLRLTRTAVDVVLGGGVLTGYQPVLDRVSEGTVSAAPCATIVPLRTRPVAGAALLGFDSLGVVPDRDVRDGVDRALRGEESG